ncbi:Chromatin modification-related protein eaf6 [Escovopsis weberi]|uniref:Chromatin modification-related protein EAF6 n=1 Tax=Escovopsis weberi TaxID=150374 RepID=A0A0M8MZN7_ESCWE|nr:Chromatin modification-related protein eaf6 [Escovopsis weberi]
MADGRQGGLPGTTSAPQPTMAEYKKSQVRVRDLVEKRRLLERRLAQMEDSIASKESTYLDSTPSGNIITGFDNYMKGTSGAAAQRRKAGPTEQNRVFSRSSISYRPNTNGDSATSGSVGSTPAPMPQSATFREGGSSHATPSSGTSGKASKSKKKDVEDSENDGQTGKKRTVFGASRK